MSCVLVLQASVLDAQNGIYEATNKEKDWRTNGRSEAMQSWLKSVRRMRFFRVNRPCMRVENRLQLR